MAASYIGREGRPSNLLSLAESTLAAIFGERRVFTSVATAQTPGNLSKAQEHRGTAIRNHDSRFPNPSSDGTGGQGSPSVAPGNLRRTHRRRSPSRRPA